MNKRTLASGVSALLNAPLVTLVTFIGLLIYLKPYNMMTLIVVTALFGCILPLLMVYGLLKLNIIKDFYAFEKDTRIIPFLWTTILYLAGAVLLIILEAPLVVTALMACYFVNGLVLMLITFKWKISIHASGLTGPVTAIVYFLGSTMLPLFLVVIPIAWARLELKAHTIMQITAGAIITTIITWIQMNAYLHGFLLR